MKSAVASFISFFLATFSSQSASAIFDYEDFGPQAAVHEIIGFQWYQWNSHGDSDPNTTDQIKVVVFWGEGLEKIKESYPVVPSKNQDYRYLDYSRAVSHLKALIKEFERIEQKTDILESTLKRLNEIKEANKALEATDASASVPHR